MAWESILQQQSAWTAERAEELRLSSEDALTLYDDAPLHQLMSAAHNRRIAMHGPSKVTYLVDRNINYTNVCTINCQFCSFYRPPGHDETYTQSLEEISGRIAALEEIGGVRILMQGGEGALRPRWAALYRRAAEPRYWLPLRRPCTEPHKTNAPSRR